MKYLICVFVIFAFEACSDSEKVPLVQKDASSDPSVDLDLDSTIDVSDDLSDVARFPDPNREGSKACEDSLDCKRFEYCTLIGDCSFGRGCGALGELPRFGDDIGCIIDESGVGELTGAECESDDICPNDMPYCYLRACPDTTPFQG